MSLLPARTLPVRRPGPAHTQSPPTLTMLAVNRLDPFSGATVQCSAAQSPDRRPVVGDSRLDRVPAPSSRDGAPVPMDCPLNGPLTRRPASDLR
jgi:hypothetical protein